MSVLDVASRRPGTVDRRRGALRRTLTGRPLLVLGVATTAWCGLLLARRQPLSWDESVTAAVATQPVHGIATTLHHTDAVLGLYYLLVHAWTGALLDLTGHVTDLGWRLPSVAGALVAVVVTADLGRRWVGRPLGLLAGPLLAVFPPFAFYATDARPYTLATAAAIGAWWVRTSLPADRGRHAGRAVWVAWVALLVTAAYLQLFTVLVWPAYLLLARGRDRRRSVLGLVVGAALVAPLVLIAAGQRGELAWIASSSVGGTLRVGVRAGGGVSVVVGLTALAALAALAARTVGAVRTGGAGQAPRAPWRPSRRTLALVWWVLAPFVLLAAMNTVTPVLVARYALVSTPMIAIGVVAVIAWSTVPSVPRRRAVQLLAAGVGVAALVTSVVQGVAPFKYEDYRLAASSTVADADAAGAGGVLFVPAATRLGWARYAGTASPVDVALPPRWTGDPLAVKELPTADVLARIDATCRVVLVGDPAGASGAAVAGMSAEDRAKLAALRTWAATDVDRFGAIDVTVLRNPRC